MIPQEPPVENHTNKSQKLIPLGHLDTDEHLICTVRKHPFGIVSLYVIFGVGIFASLGFLWILLPSVSGSITNKLTIIAPLTLLLVIAGVLFLIVATYIYHQNRLMLTDKNITQVLQYGLFSQKTSQLSMANVEDVTAEQHGIIATLFNFGTLKIETAGEQVNFIFTYCPKPKLIAKSVLESREQYIEKPDNLRSRMRT